MVVLLLKEFMALMKMRKHWNLHKISLRSQKMRKDNT
jgi:hypothetical protein